jgi:molybdenum cofactor cytidylyltransferase
MRPLASILPIVLAAGDSTRMGYPKALLPLGEEFFITRILRILRNAGLASPVLILGRAAPAIQPRIQNWAADIRINSDPDRG